MHDRDHVGHFARDAAPTPAAPHRVTIPVNLHRWEDIAFLHWPVPPASLAPLLPGGARALVHEGSAWVTMTPFRIHVQPPLIRLPTRLSVFPETNLRTYIAGPDGRQGLWFLHMEVTSAWFVAALRAIGLPYTRRRMRIDQREGALRYRSWSSGTNRQNHDVRVRPTQPLHPAHGDALTRFLTARWAAYHRRGPLLMRTPVEHPPWALQAAEVEHCEVAGLFSAARLPSPSGPALAHFSRGVPVRVGPPAIVRRWG